MYRHHHRPGGQREASCDLRRKPGKSRVDDRSGYGIPRSYRIHHRDRRGGECHHIAASLDQATGAHGDDHARLWRPGQPTYGLYGVCRGVDHRPGEGL